MKKSLRWCGTKAAVDWSSTLMPATGISKREVCIRGCMGICTQHNLTRHCIDNINFLYV